MPRKTTRRAEVRRESIRQGVSWTPSAEMAEGEIRRARRRKYRRHRTHVFLTILFISLALGGAIFYFGFDLITLQGSGMAPTLSGGQWVLCVKQQLLNELSGIVPEDYRRISKGDLVLFRYRDDEEEEDARDLLLIRRVIGTGGDVIDEGGGELILNQSELVGMRGESDLIYPITVPAGRMFLLGDQPDIAIDSRMRTFGMVAEADVVGRPLIVIWPLFAIGGVK